MKIEVFGPGCAKCSTLYTAAAEAVRETGADVELIKVDTLDGIMAAGILMPPALAIDGDVKCAGPGKLPTAQSIADWIREAHRS